MISESTLQQLDFYLSAELREGIEARYYARVNAQARLSTLRVDPEFQRNPQAHVGFYSDHGVVHVRDVASQMLIILETINGVLIPRRAADRLAFMKGYGVIAAYLHDIGMVDFSAFGRQMHPEFAAQACFRTEFDPWIDRLWQENWGNLAWRLHGLSARGLLAAPPQTVLRELLALCMCHSKSKVPVAVINAPAKLRTIMRRSVSRDLAALYAGQHAAALRATFAAAQEARHDEIELQRLAQELQSVEAELARMEAEVSSTADFNRHYPDPGSAFAWLTGSDPALTALVDDALDTQRALRCADALRQRGTVLNTSGGYQIFVDQRTANAIHAFKEDDGQRLYLVESALPISAGEANIAASELTPEGDLRIAFHRGQFASPATTVRAVDAAAMIVNDIQADVLSSFVRAADSSTATLCKSPESMRILLESTPDNPAFSRQVCDALLRLNGALHGRVEPAASLQVMDADERQRYLHARPLDWSYAEKQAALAQVLKTGHKVGEFDMGAAFGGVRLADLSAGEILIQAGSAAGFVYLPTGEGLVGKPLGGYASFVVRPWIPLGVTGVIRGEERNATIVAQRPARVLMIPGDIYLAHWHRTYTVEEFAALLVKEDER